MSRHRPTTLRLSVPGTAALVMTLSVLAACAPEEPPTPTVFAPADVATEERFGRAFALDGETLLAGAPDGDGGDGILYVFTRGDSAWEETQRLLSPIGGDGGFGAALAIEDGLALVAAPFLSTLEGGEGVVFVMRLDEEGTWRETARLTPEEPHWNEAFGSSVALSGRYALVGARAGRGVEGTVTGSAYVFERQEDDSWEQITMLAASDADSGDRFGISVALSGDRALIGAPADDERGEDAGAAYVFERQDDGSWSETTKLTLPTSDGNAGTAVALEGTRAVIGAPWALYEGVTYVVERAPDGTWGEPTSLRFTDPTPTTTNRNERFGSSVALAGDRVLVGAPAGANDNDVSTGAAYLFERLEDGEWEQVYKVSVPDSLQRSQAGRAVAVDTARLIVGAPAASTAAGEDTGVAISVER